MALMNGNYLLEEVAEALRGLAERGDRRMICLSQFPMTQEDALYLQERLGRGHVRIESGGVNPAVWRETGVAGVWWGEYYDGTKVKVRTIEITPFPELAAAADDDIREGVESLTERLCTKPA